jgi:uncharacterized protein (DUF1501 family)
VSASNALAQQFQIVARMIDAGLRGQTGTRRQVFFVSLGRFDTHDFQNPNQAHLMGRVAQAMKYFDDTLGNLGARNQVTTFTASDFGRFPLLAKKNTNNYNFDGSPDQLGNGSLLPGTSVDQLGATLGRWLGLSDSNLLGIFPNLAHWDPGQRNLGFLNA